MMTTKTLKMNFYETKENAALSLEDTLRNVQGWVLSEEARFNIQSLVLAWNTGEQTISQEGVPDTSNVGTPEWFVAFPIAFESMSLLTRGGLSLKAYQALKFLSFKGWNSASIAKMLNTGKTGGFTLWAKMCQKLSVAQEGWAGINGIKSFQKTMKYLEVIGVLIDVGLSVLAGFLIADQIGGHLGKSMGASYGIMAATYAIIYAAILFAIGEIPYVGWIISLAIVLADIFGGFSDKVTGWLMKLFGPKEDAVTQGWLEDIDTPQITIEDKDRNGLDVGDKITVKLTVTSKVNVTVGDDYSWARKSWYRPYITINAPAGSFSNTTQTGIPSYKITQSAGNWKTEQYETGASIEPGIGMPNFPVTITMNIDYGLYHSWHHWILFVPCYHDDLQSGSASSPFTTLYYDVLPGTIDDFASWRGITPLDHDGDGIVDANETTTNKFAFDSDADGLNDKFELSNGFNPNNYDTDNDGLTDGYELIFGTNATNSDTDGDDLPDYQELSGYFISFNYLGDPTKPFTYARSLRSTSKRHRWRRSKRLQ